MKAERRQRRVKWLLLLLPSEKWQRRSGRPQSLVVVLDFVVGKIQVATVAFVATIVALSFLPLLLCL